MKPLILAIPSPSRNTFGPFHFYGLMLALGFGAGFALTRKRWERAGGDPKLVGDLAFPIAIFALVGARLYHVVTSWDEYRDNLSGIAKVWNGGLSIWGAIGGSALYLIFAARRRGFDLWRFADAVAPGIAIGQAIGRFGNWFNQELFGRPTKLPWGLEIADKHLGPYPEYFGRGLTFHPTFLYESLWCLFIVGIIVLIERRITFRPGQVFALYGALYTFERFFVENLRIDPANEIGPLRINAWLSIVLFLASIAGFLVAARNRPGAPTTIKPMV